MVRFRQRAEYSEESDALYVHLSGAEVARSKPLDDARIIDVSADGAVVGIELLGVAGGVDLSDIPHRATVEKLIGELGLGIRIFA